MKTADWWKALQGRQQEPKPLVFLLCWWFKVWFCALCVASNFKNPSIKARCLTVLYLSQHGHHLWRFLCIQPHRPVGGGGHRAPALHVLQRAFVQVPAHSHPLFSTPSIESKPPNSCTVVFHSLYIAMFIYPYTWSFYTASVLVGIAAAGKAAASL